MVRHIQRIWRRLPGVAALLIASTALAQQTQTAPEDSFTLDAAILDTSIPFAVGAHEARQELRGAFGWPTFQEGLVQGVYFRFDPDGYARFSPTPRLDTDVFEVICRPRTHVCMARKDGLTLTLNSRDQIQLKLENVTDADRFSIAEGISELQLPNNLLQPMDGRMELLLSSGGELVVARAGNEVERISLKGFAAVVSYLRWVAAQQNYTVLPRDWPVPNSNAASAEITKPQDWASPMPKPLALDQTAADTEVAEVRGELRILRELLLKNEASPTQTHQASDKLGELQRALDALAQEIDGLKSEDEQALRVPAVQMIAQEANPQPTTQTTLMAQPSSQFENAENDAQQMARRMEYLMTEIGLDPEVALMVLQRGEIKAPQVADTSSANVVDALLNDLRANLQPPQEPKPPAQKHEIPAEEFQLLTTYFTSVFRPD